MQFRKAAFVIAAGWMLAACGNSAKPTARCGDGVVQPPEQCDDGNQTAGDGCEADCTMTPTQGGGGNGPTVIECAHASDPPLASGTCEVTAGSAAQLITGSVLLPGKVLHGGQVLVDDKGVIQCVDCDCSGSAAAQGATTVSCPTGVISPALVNPHDHIQNSQAAPSPDSGERYEQRNDWRLGLRGHTKLKSPATGKTDNITWGELRFVMSGATATIGGGGSAPGLLRNLDVAKDLQTPIKQAIDSDTFPLSDTNGPQLASGCNYSGFPSLTQLVGPGPYQAHVSEGIDPEARNEFLCLSGAMGGEDLTQSRDAFVHAIALTPTDYQKMAKMRTSLIWSPRSNVRLYGDTAQIPVARRLGVNIALGTDWTASGSVNMFRELACADSLNQNYFGKVLSDEDLWLMVTRNAAASANFDDILGVLKPGAWGDIAIFDGADKKDHRAVIEGVPEKVVLVERGGKALYGDAGVVNALATGCDAVDVCGTPKAACLMGEIGKDWATLQAANTASYPAIFCNGPPMDEPSCTPKRPTSVAGSTTYTGMTSSDDMDGDGIPNASDNCPTVFNPIRPVDAGAQADADGDGVGDACDTCPLDASAMSCMPVDSADADGDGIANFADNCPTVANPDQADADGDFKGDACDACPHDANPGGLSCVVSIYDIKTKPALVGQIIGVQNALVTSIVWYTTAGARKTQGFFIQTKDGDPGYMGADNSGVFVYGTTLPSGLVVGARVDINPAQVVNFHGQLELSGGTPVVKNGGATEALPAAVVVAPADIATGGAKATSLEGVLVQVQNVAVTDPAPAAAGGDTAPTNEFAVTGGLRIDDFGSNALPYTMPGADDTFASITGVLAFRNANTKIGPSKPGDLVAGPPHLATLGPNAFIRAGGATSAPTIPATAPMVIHFNAPVTAMTTVTLTSGDMNTLTVDSPVTLNPGDNDVPVKVIGVARNTTPVTITATANGVTRTGTVRVLDDGTMDAPQFVALNPMTGKVPLGGSTTLTATLDLPAPSAGVPVTIMSMNGWTLPASPAFLADTLALDLPIKQTGANLMDTITVSALGVNKQAMLSVDVHPVINEVDYDQPSTDSSEFIEIFNPNPVAVDLSNLVIVLATNSQNEYRRIQLTGMLNPGGGPDSYLVVGTTTLNATVPMGVRTIALPLAQDNITNTSSNPTGIALVDTSTNTVVDSVSFGPGTAGVVAQITGVTGKTTFAEGRFKSVNDSGTTKSCARHPNGQDTNDMINDWTLATTPSAGSANP